jgi:hypothetical protein
MKTQLFKLSLSLFVIYSLTACNNKKPVEVNTTNVEETKRLEAERKRIEEEKLAMDAEKKAMEETKEKDRLAAVEKLEKKFQNISVVVVTTNKTYFHDAPDFSTKRKAYLVRSDMANLLRTRNGFGYVEYYNYDTDKTTSGWISLTDLAEEGSDHMSE